MQLGAEVKKLIRGPGIFQRSCQKASTPQPLALEIEYGTGRKKSSGWNLREPSQGL